MLVVGVVVIDDDHNTTNDTFLQNIHKEDLVLLTTVLPTHTAHV